MEERKTPDEDPALAETQAAIPSDGARAVGTSPPADADPLVGQILGDTYTVVELVDAGGMGRVYKAVHITLGKVVAVKVLARYDSAELTARFARESQVTAQLSHPHLVYAHDAGTCADGRPYLVMEYLAGQSLRALLESTAWLDLRRALRIARQVAEALVVVHDAGIAHRDLKPENVFLVDHSGRDDFVKVLDFGLAKPTAGADARLTMDGTAIGTPAYMSPEQARGEETDQRTDVYALGCLLYEMLAGCGPYDAQCQKGMPQPTSAVVVARMLAFKADKVAPALVRRYRPDIPEGVARLVMSALEPDKVERLASMGDFAEGIDQALRDMDADRGTDPPRRLRTLIGVGMPNETSRRKSFPVFWGVAAVAVLAVVVAVIAQSGKEPVASDEANLAPAGRETATAPAVEESTKSVVTPPPAAVQTVKHSEPTLPPVATVPPDVSAAPPTVGVTPPPPAVSKPPRAAARRTKLATPVPRASRPRPAEGPKGDERVRETRRRDEARQVNVAELRKAAQDTKVALRRNPRNRELRARLNGVCRELTELGETISECQ